MSSNVCFRPEAEVEYGSTAIQQADHFFCDQSCRWQKHCGNYALIDNDIITVGNHRIKFCDPHAKSRRSLAGDEFGEPPSGRGQRG